MRLKRASPPQWVEPTLATLVHEPFSDPRWIYEPKLDGERCLAFRQGGRVGLWSRNRKSLDSTYPELVETLTAEQGVDLVADGEIVAFADNRSSFARLQSRLQLASASDARGSPVSVYLYLFDLVYAAGYDLRQLALRDRKKLLQAALCFADPLRFTSHRVGDGERAYREACDAGLEGLIAKDGDSTYTGGRSRNWLKFKCVTGQELVIGGYTEPSGQRNYLGALLVGYYEGGALVYAGKVGTGFDNDTLAFLAGELAPLERGDCPFSGGDVREKGAHWVDPRLVAELAFTEWTQDGKLRHPRYLGLRRDKDPTQVTRERHA